MWTARLQHRISDGSQPWLVDAFAFCVVWWCWQPTRNRDLLRSRCGDEARTSTVKRALGADDAHCRGYSRSFLQPDVLGVRRARVRVIGYQMAALRVLSIFLLALPLVAYAGERVELWQCPGNLYTDAPCAGGRLLLIDPSANSLASETRQPARIVADSSGPSVLMIPKPTPHLFESPSAPHPGFVFGPPTINVRLVR